MEGGVARKRYQMFVGGRWRDAASGATLPSVNPTTDEIWSKIADATAEDVDEAVRAANTAFEDGPWRRMAPTERGRILKKIAARIPELSEHLGRTETIDTGKLYRETRWQAKNVAEVYDFYGSLADKLPGQVAPAGHDQAMSMVVYEPVGVVAAIVPWNSQLHLAAFKIAPALAAGNTIVLKPSEQASAALLEFAQVLADAGLPPGVFNVVTGGPASCGATLTRHPMVRRISFTGGIETARKIIPNTAHNIARMSLELGGKSPMLVFEDSDIDSAINGVVAGIFAASGQSCAAGSRLLLQNKIYDNFLDRLVARARRIKIGDPLAEDTEMGPLATTGQLDRINKHLSRSLEMGAELLTGGKRPAALNRGNFIEPTIVRCDHQDYPIVQNELFGPVLSVLRFDTEEEAVRMANDSRYAFAGGIFTRDVARALRLTRQVRAGRLWVNTYRTSSLFVPFGGFKESGFGRESGYEAIRDYCDTKGIFIDTSGQPVADPFIMR
jgi:acyl-CoA reductase-like NAD-dependent aldehyde dehydrogenase